MNKVYIKVDAVFDEDGVMRPQSLIWRDGRKYEIDYITDIRQAASMKSGGYGDRYTITVCGQRRYLFFERITDRHNRAIGRWFVEGIA